VAQNLSPLEAHRLLVASSGKLSVLQQLLPPLLAAGHRVLIFSQSKEMLTLLEDFLADFHLLSGGDADVAAVNGAADVAVNGSGARGVAYHRLDGDTKPQQRSAMIDAFNDPASEARVFLMSTRAGEPQSQGARRGGEPLKQQQHKHLPAKAQTTRLKTA
jgi:hypothetical protein